MADYLMDGVKILNTNPPAHPGYLAVYIIVAIIFSFLIIGTSIILGDTFGNMVIDIIVSIILAIICGSVLGNLIWDDVKRNLKPETYDVTIDESVSFREFDEKYEVVERNGEIYTIKERASDE